MATIHSKMLLHNEGQYFPWGLRNSGYFHPILEMDRQKLRPNTFVFRVPRREDISSFPSLIIVDKESLIKISCNEFKLESLRIFDHFHTYLPIIKPSCARHKSFPTCCWAFRPSCPFWSCTHIIRNEAIWCRRIKSVSYFFSEKIFNFNFWIYLIPEELIIELMR